MNNTNRIFPIKVRLIKPNPTNENKVVFNDIELFTYKDTLIEDVDTLMKIRPMEKYLIIKSELKESTFEIHIDSESSENNEDDSFAEPEENEIDDGFAEPTDDLEENEESEDEESEEIKDNEIIEDNE